MAEDKHSNQSSREQFRFYSTFDGEIVQIDESSSPVPSVPGGPRTSLPPVPVIPGSLSLSDAIVIARQRREAELQREREEDDRFDDEDLFFEELPELAQPKNTAEPTGDPLITAVSPGHFQRRTGSGQPPAAMQVTGGDEVLGKTLLTIFEEGANSRVGNFS